MNKPIEDYALIGDGASAALVARDGAIDWLCWPRFDSDAAFAALLGNEEHGRWRIAPAVAGVHTERRYVADTLVLETDFEIEAGAARLIDFMPRRDQNPALVRILVGLRGSVPMRFDFAARFDYGSIAPWVSEHDRNCVIASVGPDLIALRSGVPLRVAHECSSADFTISEGQRIAFTLSHGESVAPASAPPDAEGALRETTRWWQDWASRFDNPTPWREPVMRSLITLKALIHNSTGGLVAAATTSLPEVPGGKANWDYRFCWLRDATFTLSALLNAGYHEEAHAWREWILRAVAGSPERLKIMYRVDGGRQTQEWQADWLPGYDGARPVRVGNAAAEQRQVDVFGEVLDALHLAARAGIAETEASRHLEAALAERIAQVWQEGGQGLWESRSEPQQYTYSKMMCWAGLDRFIRGIQGRDDGADLTRWRRLRDEIHSTVCERGYRADRGHFVATLGGDGLDASLLLLPILDFLPATDPRISGTVAAIERELTEDGLVFRKPGGSSGHKQGAFIACSCWLADCQRLQGRRDAAVATLERVLALRNDVGLLSEEYDLGRRRLSGNFPQALSHLALVNTALGLSGPVLTRGGG